MILATLLLASALSQPVHGHWPDAGIVNTTCENVLRVLSKGEPSEMLYNSVQGILMLVFEYADGTRLELFYHVTDLIHEEAADVSIRIEPTPFMYKEHYKSLHETWVDKGGNGVCTDFRLYVP